MAEKPRPDAPAQVPPTADLHELRGAAAGCRACDLWQRGTQTVFGEGRAGARVMLVGEQPGDQEDVAGRPFVGPAGQLLDEALERAGLDRAQVYVTNTVKHFKWEPRGKRRLHKKPDWREIDACMPWLQAEIAAVGPEIVVCLGATAAQALLGKTFRVTRERGVFFESPLGVTITATVHPSAILRAPDEAARAEGMRALVDDLRRVAERL